MTDAHLTDRTFWENYWKNYEYEKIPSKVPFNYLMPLLKDKNNFIEIGGFPGVFAAYFYKKGCKNVSLLDFYIDQQIVNKFEEKNDIPANTITCIESDFFKFQSSQKYDIVFSYGFIEHFSDTEDVINRHIQLLADQGRLLIVLPNFRGINGWVQYIFDRKNYDAHNMESMKITYLREIIAKSGLQKASVEYTRKPIVWLSPNVGTLLGRKCIKLFSHFLKLFPIKCSLLSPYIVIYAEKE